MRRGDVLPLRRTANVLGSHADALAGRIAAFAVLHRSVVALIFFIFSRPGPISA